MSPAKSSHPPEPDYSRSRLADTFGPCSSGIVLPQFKANASAVRGGGRVFYRWPHVEKLFRRCSPRPGSCRCRSNRSWLPDPRKQIAAREVLRTSASGKEFDVSKDNPQPDTVKPGVRGEPEPPFCWMNVNALRLIDRCSDAPATTAWLYSVLCWLAADEGRLPHYAEFTVAHSYIANRARLSVPTVKRHLATLQDSQLLSIETPELKAWCAIAF